MVNIEANAGGHHSVTLGHSLADRPAELRRHLIATAHRG
jgi:hypothetical protein